MLQNWRESGGDKQRNGKKDRRKKKKRCGCKGKD